MLTKVQLQNGSSRHQFGRTMRHGLSAGPIATIGSVSSMGGPTGFIRDATIYEQRQAAGQLYQITSGVVRTCDVLIDGRRQIAAFDLAMPRKDIADYLGLSIETVSRVLTQLENESAIELLTSKKIVLHKQAALRRLLA